jgi:mannose-6-phosphate isomerase-like protein (cupin superfamily)
MEIRRVNLKEKAEKIYELHKYKLVAKLNDYHIKLIKAKREFIWHRHEETDEMFLVVKGRMKLALKDRVFDLSEDDMIVVPKGIDHKPICDSECVVMLVEPKGTVNTGNVGGDLTDTELEWI